MVGGKMIKLNADPIILIYRKAKEGSKNDYTLPVAIYLSEEKTGLAVEAPLIMTNTDGTPTADMDAAYFRDKR